MPNESLIEGKYTVQALMDTAEKVVKKKTDGTSILDLEAERRIPKFCNAELTLGRVLGRGGFCVVNEVTKIALKTSGNSADGSPLTDFHLDDEHAIHNIVQDRSFMEVHCLRRDDNNNNKGNNKDKSCRYALKQLQDSSRENAQTYVNGVVDLAVEARFLSVIRHPNIIKMRAMAATSPYSIQEPFFVVLDRLYDIMGTRLAKWKKQKPSGMKRLLDRGGKKELAFWVERVTVGYDLACALQYLHDLHIVYRDLKPDNIGFDIRGDVKIFDFGLAKEFDPTKQDANGFYKMTGDTGSPRYMAPEVALEKPYDERVDVYSFCILLWQMLQLETPFEGYSMSMFNKKVVQGGFRPKCDPKWPAAIIDLLQRAWGDASKRPSMSDVASTLRNEISEHTDLSDSGRDILDASRKSEASLRGAAMHNKAR